MLLLPASLPPAPVAGAVPAGKPLVLKDAAGGGPALAASDCIEVRAEPAPDGGLDLAVTLAAPLDLARLSYSTVAEQEIVGEKQVAKSWMNHPLPAK